MIYVRIDINLKFFYVLLGLVIISFVLVRGFLGRL